MQIETLYREFLNSSGVCTDTRKITSGGIFFALKGDNFNGNAYAAKALAEGCSLAVVDEEEFAAGDQTILVNNVLETLQKLAKHHRNQLSIPIIGITGSNGKTSTKELIASVLKERFNTFATFGNLNNHIGVPLSLLSITCTTEIAVIEMGANAPDEIGELCEISMPDFGLITNIGKAHLEGFGTYEEVQRTKNQLFEKVIARNGLLFVNADDPTLLQLSSSANRITYGTNTSAGTIGEVLTPTPFARLNWNGHTIQTQLIGTYNFPNIMAAISIGLHFGVEPQDIVKGLESYVPKNNRSQLTETDSNKLILDAYNANPVSMNAAIENFSAIEADQKLPILGDMLELGTHSLSEHQAIVDLLIEKDFQSVILVGAEFAKTSTQNSFQKFPNAQAVIDSLKENQINNHLVLIKGSRGIQLEKLKDFL